MACGSFAPVRQPYEPRARPCVCVGVLLLGVDRMSLAHIGLSRVGSGSFATQSVWSNDQTVCFLGLLKPRWRGQIGNLPSSFRSDRSVSREASLLISATRLLSPPIFEIDLRPLLRGARRPR